MELLFQAYQFYLNPSLEFLGLIKILYLLSNVLNLHQNSSYSLCLKPGEKINTCKIALMKVHELFIRNILLLHFTHAFRAPWLPVYASTQTPQPHSLTFLNHLPHSFLKIIPFYGVITWQDLRKSLLVGPQGWSMPTTIISSVTSNQRWKLATWISHSKDICCCTSNEIQCS